MHTVWARDSIWTNQSFFCVFLQLEPRYASFFPCSGEEIKGGCLGVLWPHLQAHKQSLSSVGRMEPTLRKAEVADRERGSLGSHLSLKPDWPLPFPGIHYRSMIFLSWSKSGKVGFLPLAIERFLPNAHKMVDWLAQPLSQRGWK